jgi:hypothetical protein
MPRHIRPHSISSNARRYSTPFEHAMIILRHSLGDQGITRDDLDQLLEIMEQRRCWKYRDLYEQIAHRVYKEGYFKLPVVVTDTTQMELGLNYTTVINNAEHANWCKAEAKRRYNGKLVMDIGSRMLLVLDEYGFTHTDAVLRALSNPSRSSQGSNQLVDVETKEVYERTDIHIALRNMKKAGDTSECLEGIEKFVGEPTEH